jgi:hypothetical protein
MSAKTSGGKRVQTTIEKPKIDEKMRQKKEKEKEKSKEKEKRKSREINTDAPKDAPKDAPRMRTPTNSFMELSEMSVGSELQYDELEELSSHLDNIIFTKKDEPAKVAKSAKTGKARKAGKKKTTAGNTAQSQSEDSDDVPVDTDKVAVKAKTPAFNAVATSKEVIKANIKGYKKLKADKYEIVKKGDYIKHINANGYLSNGGYVVSVGISPCGPDKELKLFWLISTNMLGEGAFSSMRPYKMYPSNMKRIYLEEKKNVVPITMDTDIKTKLDEKQHYINDIVYFLHSKYPEFGNYMEERARTRQSKMKDKHAKSDGSESESEGSRSRHKHSRDHL